MKKYVLSYKDFLNKLNETTLTPEQSARFKNIEIVKEVKKIHNKIFGESERIYIPFDFSYFKASEKSSTQLEIENLLTSKGYEIISYSQNQCKKPNDSRITKIGKVLRDKKGFNNERLAVAYGQDVESTRGVSDTSEMLVVISRNSDDIASMSTNRAWDSCQNLNNFNPYHNKVYEDIEQGTIIAYLVKNDDKEIEDPEARILIKPFENSKDYTDIVLLPATKVYFRGKNGDYGEQKYPKFLSFLMTWAKSVQPNIKGTYEMNSKVYPDGNTKRFLGGDSDDIVKEFMENLQLPESSYYPTTYDFLDDYKIEISVFEGSLDEEIEDRYGFVVISFNDRFSTGYSYYGRKYKTKEDLLKSGETFYPVETDGDKLEYDKDLTNDDADVFVFDVYGSITNIEETIEIYNNIIELYYYNDIFEVRYYRDGETEDFGVYFGEEECIDGIKLNITWELKKS